MKPEVCFLTWHNQGMFEGVLLAHVGDLLFTGSGVFRHLIASASESLRTGEVADLAENPQSRSLDY